MGNHAAQTPKEWWIAVGIRRDVSVPSWDTSFSPLTFTEHALCARRCAWHCRRKPPLLSHQVVREVQVGRSLGKGRQSANGKPGDPGVLCILQADSPYILMGSLGTLK